jgi:tetratricopeptide (TPR) repeat protein
MAEGERKTQIIQMAIDLCEHTLQNCRESNLLLEAAQQQSLCYMEIGQVEKVFELLCDENQMPLQYGVGNGKIVSQAHQKLRNFDKANAALQIELYKNIMATFDVLLSYIRLNLGNYETARPAFERAENLAENFNMRRLNSNNAAVLYIWGAHMYQAAGENEKALKTLGKYVDVCIHGFFPFMPRGRGDSFFNRIDKWLNEENEASPLPRNEAVVKESMLNYVLLDFAFDNLHENPEFTNLVQKMRNFIGGQ